MKRAGGEQPEGGYQSLDGSAADTFRDVGAPAPVEEVPERESERRPAEPGALTDLPVGLFEPVLRHDRREGGHSRLHPAGGA